MADAGRRGSQRHSAAARRYAQALDEGDAGLHVAVVCAAYCTRYVISEVGRCECGTPPDGLRSGLGLPASASASAQCWLLQSVGAPLQEWQWNGKMDCELRVQLQVTRLMAPWGREKKRLGHSKYVILRRESGEHGNLGKERIDEMDIGHWTESTVEGRYRSDTDSYGTFRYQEVV